MSIPFLKSKPGAAREEDPLALFEAESTLSIDGGSVATVADARVQATRDEEDVDLSLGSVATSEPIALESVLARKMFLSWPEGVAIVEGTCAALVRANGSELGAPEPSDILLTAEGTIEVNGRGHRGESVQRLARTLHDVTSGQAIPAPFRLFISKWIAVDGRHTIAEFARELAYFARPNGRDLIREVYERALAELIAQPLEPPRRKQAAAEGPKPKAEKPKPKPANKRQQAVLAAAVAFVITAAVAAAILGSTAPPPGQEGSSDIVSNLLARAADFAR